MITAYFNYYLLTLSPNRASDLYIQTQKCSPISTYENIFGLAFFTPD
jgi:hypothetical protein